MKIKKSFNDQLGIAMVLALVMLLILSLIGLGASYSSIIEIKLSGNKRGTVDAFYAADSGVQVVMANAANFNLENFVNDKYDAFTDLSDPNLTQMKVIIEHQPNRKGPPRGFGMSAVNVDFEHYMIESTGSDRLELSPANATCTIYQKVVRLVPTLQGGY